MPTPSSGSPGPVPDPWDLRDAGGFRALAGHRGRIAGCAVSPDASFVVSASHDRTVRLWNPLTGISVHDMWAHQRAVTACAVSPDAAFGVSASGDETLSIWDPREGLELRRLVGHDGFVSGCAVSPDGSLIASSGADWTVKLWDAATGRLVRSIDAHDDEVLDVAFGPDGTWLVSAGADGTLGLWRTATGDLVHRMRGHKAPVVDCAVSPDGTFIASAGSDGVLRTWDAEEGGELRVMSGSQPARACVVSPDGRYVLAGGSEGGLAVWWAMIGKVVQAVPLRARVTCVATHPWLPAVVVGDADGAVGLLALADLEYGPIVVTARAGGAGPVLRCPACHAEGTLGSDQLGAEVVCPGRGCRLHLRVNPFIVGTGPEARSGRRPPGSVAAGAATAPSPSAADAERSLVGLLEASGIPFAVVDSDRYAISLPGRTGPVTVRASTYGSDIVLLEVRLPPPARFGGDAALRALLQVSVRADYTKALSLAKDELAIACELPLALLTPVRLAGLARGLAALGDVQSRDLGDASGWSRRLAACRAAQAEIGEDPVAAMAAFRAAAAAAPLLLRDVGPGVVITELYGLGSANPLKVVTQVSERVVSLVASLEDARPHGNRGAYMRRLLDMNRLAEVARVGLDAGDHVTLVYEVPEVDSGLLDRVREQFGALLEGVIRLEQGR